MTEKQQEFQTNLVQFLANISGAAAIADIIPIYHISFSKHSPGRTTEHLSALLSMLEREGVISCEWTVARDTDVVRTVALARTLVVEDPRHPSLTHGV